MVRKNGAGEEKEVLSAMARMEEFISDHRLLKFKGNQDVDSITEVAALKVGGANEIRELYRAIGEIPENRVKVN